jgi:hypothetical protein
VRKTADSDPLVVGFAGSLGYGYADAILSLADALAEEGGRLVIASPTPRHLFDRVFSHPAVSDLGALAPEAVKDRLIQCGVNVLSVIQSFAKEDMRGYRFNFPSKLTEYSTYGLPLFVVTPEDASASVWTKDNPNSALAIHSFGCHEMVDAVRRLKRADVRRALACGFHSAARLFDPALLQRQFEEALTKSCNISRTE